MKTFFARKKDIKRKWYIVDAEGMVLGRLASRVASILKGKTKPIYTPNIDTGDYVVIINADKIRLTGNKLQDKVYFHHSGYPGGLKQKTAKELMQKTPEKMIFSAIKGMLPKNTLGRTHLRKLKVYSSTEHPHTTQNPELLKL